MHTKFNKDWFSHSKVVGGRDTHTHTQKPTFIFSKKGKYDKKVKLSLCYYAMKTYVGVDV
jgi:hypothetical protein